MMRWFLLLLLTTVVAFADTARVGDTSALVIIDMQEAFITRGGNEKKPENIRKVNEVIERQIELIQLARQQNIPIIFIEYEDHGSTTSRLRNAVRGYQQTRTFKKSTDGMLDHYNKNLDRLSEYLQVNKIGNLVIAGANGGACVQMSIYGALQKEYHVIAYSRGIADFNFEDFVYPYDDQYKFLERSDCPECFREVDDLPTLSAMLSESRTPASSAGVNDSDRSIPRAEIQRRSRERMQSPSTTQQ